MGFVQSFLDFRAAFRVLAGLAVLAFLLASSPAASEEVEESDSAQRADSEMQETEPPGEMGQGAQASALSAATLEGVDDPPAGGIEEIVVTARRREESLQDTPISISSLGSQTLLEAQVTRFDEIAFLVPNLRMSNGRSGGSGSASIRGVGATESGNPGVGTYVDGVYFQRSNASIMNIADIQQVEVLRGPQGTLFGKNTLGGALSIRTVPPREELFGRVYVRGGSFGTIETRSSVDIPVTLGALEDKVFTRFSLSTSNIDGYTLNTATGESFNNRNALWFLTRTRIVPVDNLEINLSGNYFRDRNRGRGGQCVGVDAIPNPLAYQLLLFSTQNGFSAACEATQPYEFATRVDTVYSTEDYGFWGNATYNFGAVGFLDDLSVRLLGSWRGTTNENREDIDKTIENVTVLSNISISGNNVLLGPGGELLFEPFTYYGEPFEGHESLIEAQIFGEALDSDLFFVGGFFASWKNESYVDLVRALADQDGVSFADTLGGFTRGEVSKDDNDWAFYGQTTWNVLDWISLTGGIRYTAERRGVHRRTTYPTTGLETANNSGKKSFTRWTPMASVALFAPDSWLEENRLDHLMGYFTYSNGFSSGGFNAVIAASTGTTDSLIPFDPATLNNYEIGIKMTAFDRRLTFTIALFHMDYNNIQLTQTTHTKPPGSDIPEVSRLIVNADTATLRGLEAEIQLIPVDGLLLMANFGVLDSEFGNFPDPWALIGAEDKQIFINRKGESFNGVPKFTSYIALEYTHEIAFGPRWLRGQITPRIDWYYQSKVHNVQPEDPSGHMPAYYMMNARLSYDFWDDRFQIAAWGRNLNNAEVFDGGGDTTSSFAFANRYYREPRTFGGEFRIEFSAD